LTIAQNPHLSDELLSLAAFLVFHAESFVLKKKTH
jgi:hypothetical protein